MKVPHTKGTTLVVLNKKWAIQIDRWGNHIPIQFVSSYIMDRGKNKGDKIPSGWVLLDKYFGTVYHCAKWIVTEGLLDEKIMGLEAYQAAHLKGLSALAEDFKKAVKEMKG